MPARSIRYLAAIALWALPIEAGAQSLSTPSPEVLRVTRTADDGGEGSLRWAIERKALRLPAIYMWPDYTEDGALIGYGPVQTQVYRQVARMLARVLRGAKPAELPVEQPTIFELAINLDAAKALGLTVPMNLLSRADKVI